MTSQRHKNSTVFAYVKDEHVMDKIKEKYAKDNRSISQWSYLVLRKAALGDEGFKKEESPIMEADIKSHK
jgi:hypothetical protein